MFYWFLKFIALGPLLRVVFRPRAEGLDNVPSQGAAILASNHLSYADWLFMPLVLTRRVSYVAKAEYFTGTGVKGRLQRTFFSGSGQIPIDRSGANAAEGALISAKGVLGRGELFGIFPEGTRSHDGRLYRGKTGVARLALETGVPVVPVAVIGTDTVAPPARSSVGSCVRRCASASRSTSRATRAWRATATSCAR
ncbi:lysophospholipid acyltransferase family protein [Nocardioides zeae]